MEGEDYRDSEVEADSDHEDQDDQDLQDFHMASHQHFSTDLDSSETGTVRRRAKTIVTPKMAMESFRLSFLNDDEDVNFDAILGELSELETQLTTTQSELSQSLASGMGHGVPRYAAEGSDTIQAELDALAAEITLGLSHKKTNGQLLMPTACEQISDAGETDSAFSDNASLPSSESFTSMATVSSSAETTSSSSGETSSMTSAMSTATLMNEEEQLHRLKAEKIRIALEKIREAKIRKLFVRAFAKDGSSKSILVDEKMTVGQVCSLLADKHHGRLTHSMAVVEHMPELFMERILEDHDSLVENMVMWTRDSKNKVLFEERLEKYNLFFQPEKYLLSGSFAQWAFNASEARQKYLLSGSFAQKELGSSQREHLIQEFFSPAGVAVPQVEGALYLKSDGKKAWKKYFFVLRASGLYYNPKGKVSKAPRDLVCLVQFEFVEVYRGIGWKKKYHSPTDSCFALKHPQIQKKTSKYIRYFCAENDTALDQWIMGIRIAKLGKQLLHNFEHVHHEISTWDLHLPSSPTVSLDYAYSSPSSSSSRSIHVQELGDHYQSLNPSALHDSRLCAAESSPHHTIVTVHNNISSVTVHNNISSHSHNLNEGVGVAVISHHKGSDGGIDMSGSHKTPTKRVSFSNTHCIITDSSEQLVATKHRDSIVSASTDSSEDSNSSGEGRHIMANTLRGKLRPKLPVTTETTRLLTEMNQLSFDGDRDGSLADETSSLSSASSLSSRHNFSRSERRRSSMTERRGSDTANGRGVPVRLNGCSGGTPLSPSTASRRHSHEGSPDPMPPSLRHTGTQQWVDDHQESMEVMPSVPEASGHGYGMPGTEDQYMYAGGISHYQQIPSQNHQQHYERELPQQYPPDVNSELYATITQRASQDTPSLQSPACGFSFEYPPCEDAHVSVEAGHLPPPHFQESSPPLPPLSNTQLKMSAPPTAPKPSGPPPPLPPSSSAHKQLPPPVLPKSVPVQVGVASSQPANNRNPSAKPSTVQGDSVPTPALARPAVPPPAPPVVSCTSPTVGKVGPPTLPKSSGAAPMSPVSSQGSLKHGKGVSSLSSQSVASPSSAPPLLSKSGCTPAGYHIGDSVYECVQQPPSPHKVGSPNSPHRVSHIKYPSTGSPMLGMGPSPPNNKGPTPSDSGYIEGDTSSSCSGSPSNPPYLHDLSRRPKGPSPGTSPPNSCIQASDAVGQHGSSANHRRSASAGSTIVKGVGKSDGGRKAPPPPPKRSESTRLSAEVPKQVTNTPPASPSTQNTPPVLPDPIYENCEGIMDISELPPPPPELLAGLSESSTKTTATSSANTISLSQHRNSKKQQQKLPPPPPVRSKDTHLTQSH